MDDPQRREAILNALTHGSAASWQHVNLLGEYDFSEERLQDTVGISPQNWLTKQESILGAAELPKVLRA